MNSWLPCDSAPLIFVLQNDCILFKDLVMTCCGHVLNNCGFLIWCRASLQTVGPHSSNWGHIQAHQAHIQKQDDSISTHPTHCSNHRSISYRMTLFQHIQHIVLTTVVSPQHIWAEGLLPWRHHNILGSRCHTLWRCSNTIKPYYGQETYYPNKTISWAVMKPYFG